MSQSDSNSMSTDENLKSALFKFASTELSSDNRKYEAIQTIIDTLVVERTNFDDIREKTKRYYVEALLEVNGVPGGELCYDQVLYRNILLCSNFQGWL